MYPLYTKTFGGKIWTKLHNVSPHNFFQKKFLEVTLQKFFVAKKFTRGNKKISPWNYCNISHKKSFDFVKQNRDLFFSFHTNIRQSAFNFERSFFVRDDTRVSWKKGKIK